MIPETIEPLEIINNLNKCGLSDYRVEKEAGLTKGYISQIRCGNVKNISYVKGAKLLNLAERYRGGDLPMSESIT